MHNHIKFLIILILSTFTLLAVPTNSNVNSDQNISKELREAFLKKPSKLLKNIPQKNFLKKLYKKNNYAPLWMKKNRFDKVKYQTLVSHIKTDITLEKKGLIYQNYEKLSKEVDQNLSKLERLRLDIKLSSLYYNFLLHSVYGEIEWKNFKQKLKALKRKRINADWVTAKPKYNLYQLLLEENINETVDIITPKNFGYSELLEVLKRLKELQAKGAWEPLPSFKKLELGSTGDIVLQLRERLKISNDYTECNESNISKFVKTSNDTNQSSDLNLSREAVFGYCLDKAVKTFQQRHGLVVDGVVGPATQRILNTTIEEKIHKVRLNIDRIKWLPREEQERYVIVNIPEFMLNYIEDGEVKQELRVIVGDWKHPTPIFSENISYIVLNPYWKVPEGIVKREVIPAMVKDPNYLKKEGLQAHETWNENSPRVDTSWIYWEQYLYGKEKFPYRLMQPPGPKNALGKIKFKFPNRFSVYLHDTPTKHLFKRTVRAFSHGCVRLSEPKKFLETISTFNPKIDMKKANKRLKGKRKQFVKVDNKLRIYLVYLTVGMSDDGKIEFRNDIYNYDKYQKRRLR